MKEIPTSACDILSALGVNHTVRFTNSEFRAMPFRSLFGLSKLLKSYGIDSEGYELKDHALPEDMPLPFFAGVGGRYIVVTGVGGDRVEYLDGGTAKTLSRSRFDRLFNGIVMVCYPGDGACEPDYLLHRAVDTASAAKMWVMAACMILVAAYFFVTRGLFHSWGACALVVFNLVGLGASVLLLRKSLGIKDRAAEHVCGVLQAGGCDSIMEKKASKFFGLFSWSEVGFSYFSISLAVLLLFPSQWGHLALLNACCLPFTAWSIWYQRFRARSWCTLCVIVQATLWAMFFCYLLGGLWHGVFSGIPSLVALALSYPAALLLLNAFDSLKPSPRHEKD